VWVPVGNRVVVVHPELVVVIAELPGVGPPDQFSIHVVDDSLWLIPNGRRSSVRISSKLSDVDHGEVRRSRNRNISLAA
jgi:hypothetical protein